MCAGVSACVCVCVHVRKCLNPGGQGIRASGRDLTNSKETEARTQIPKSEHAGSGIDPTQVNGQDGCKGILPPSTPDLSMGTHPSCHLLFRGVLRTHHLGSE